MPVTGVTFTVGGNASGLITALGTVEKVAKQSGSSTAAALKQAEAALMKATDGMKSGVREMFVYEAGLQKIRGELKLLEQAEIAATKAMADRAAAAMAARRAGGLGIHDEAAIQKQSQYESMFKGQRIGYYDEAAIQKQSQYESMFKGQRIGYYDEAAIQKSIQSEQYKQFWMQNAAPNLTTSQKIKEYYERKKAQGGVNVYAPSGFGAYMQREAAASQQAGTTAGKGFFRGFLNAIKGSGSSTAQIVSIISNTASSMGSGISWSTIAAQQIPNLIQAFVMLGASIRTVLGYIARFAGIAGAVAIVGAAAYKTYSYFRQLSDSIKDADGPMGRARLSIEQLNNAMRNAADSTQKYKEWLKSLRGEVVSVSDKTDTLLKRLREKYLLEREIAKENGAGKPELDAMDLKQLAKEQDVVNRAREKAYEDLKRHKSEAAAAQSSLSSASSQERNANIDAAAAENIFKSRVVDALRNELGIASLEKASPTDSFVLAVNDSEVVWETAAERIRRFSNQTKTVTVDGKKYSGSLNQAISEMKGAAADEKRLKEIRSKLEDSLKEKQKLTEEDIASIRRLAKEEADIISKMNAAPTTQARSVAVAGTPQPLTERERIGAYAGGMNVSLVDLSKKQLAALEKVVNRLETVNKTIEKNY